MEWGKNTKKCIVLVLLCSLESQIPCNLVCSIWGIKEWGLEEGEEEEERLVLQSYVSDDLHLISIILRQGRNWCFRLWNGITEKEYFSGAAVLSDMEMHLNSIQ